MAKLTKERAVTLEQIKETLSNSLGSDCELLLKDGRLEVVRDELRGCMVKIKRKNSKTDVFFGPFVPSTGLAVMMSLLCCGGAVVMMLFVNVIVGIVLLPMSVIIRLLPSSGVVKQVKDILLKM